MKTNQVLDALVRAEVELRGICHSHEYGTGGAHEKANENIQVALCLIRNAYVYVNEGEDAKVPAMEDSLAYYRRMMALQERMREKAKKEEVGV